MQPERFDSLTRMLGGTVSRRQAVKLLLATAVSGISNAVSARMPEIAAPPQGTEPEHTVHLPAFTRACVYGPEPVTFEYTGADQLAVILEEAEGYEDYLSLRWLLEQTRTPALEEGALIFREGREVAHVALIHFEAVDSPDPAYLIYASNECDEYMSIAIRLELENDFALGFYYNVGGSIQVELVDLAQQTAHQASTLESEAHLQHTSGVTESCQLCLDSCTYSEQLRDRTCEIQGAVAVVQMGFAARSLIRRAFSELSHIVAEVVQDILDIQSIHSAGAAIHDCVHREQMDCTENGAMCGEICAGCDSADGITCPSGRVCSGGECRTPCGDVLCRTSETCIDGSCVPISHNCLEPYAPMGWYWWGYTWAPACCALGPAIDCGTKDDEGQWGGCCPPGTVCGRTESGFGCCFPGVNC